MGIRKGLLMVAGLILTGTFLLLTGCGGGSGHIRLVNAMPDEPYLSMMVDSTVENRNVGYGKAGSYYTTNGSHVLTVRPTGTTVPLFTETVSASSDTYQTLIAYNYSYSDPIEYKVVQDKHVDPPTGWALLRIINLSPGMGTQDVYVVKAGVDITTGAVPATYTNVTFGQVKDYEKLAGGNYEVYFTDPGYLYPNCDSGPFKLGSKQVRTLIGLDYQGGGYTTSTLTDKN